MPWGTISDRFGRRPVYMGCLLILCLTCIGLALVPTSDYWLLVLLRCIQAAGSAPTIAISELYSPSCLRRTALIMSRCWDYR